MIHFLDLQTPFAHQFARDTDFIECTNPDTVVFFGEVDDTLAEWCKGQDFLFVHLTSQPGINQSCIELAKQLRFGDQLKETRPFPTGDKQIWGTASLNPDNVGAMALCQLGYVDPEIKGRIKEIAQFDPTRSAWQPFDYLTYLEESSELSAIADILVSPHLSLRQKVEGMRHWLVGRGDSSDFRTYRRQKAEKIRATLLSKETQVLQVWGTPPDSESYAQGVDWELGMVKPYEKHSLVSPIVYVQSGLPPDVATAIGYQTGPVVVVTHTLDPANKTITGYTIAEYEEGWVDLTQVGKELNSIEPNWSLEQPFELVGVNPKSEFYRIPPLKALDVVQKNLCNRNVVES